MTLLKNVVLWDRPPPRSTGVPNLFGLFPLRCQSANGKAPNKLGIPTGAVFFNRIFDTGKAVMICIIGWIISFILTWCSGPSGGWEPSASAGCSALRSDTDSLRDQRSPLRSPEEGFSSWHSDHNIPFHTLMASLGKLGKELHHHLCDASPQTHCALQA